LSRSIGLAARIDGLALDVLDENTALQINSLIK
jgi:hypothetical protein